MVAELMVDPDAATDFTPALVERILDAWEHWPWLCTPRDPNLPVPPLNASSDSRVTRRTAERADVGRALLWLAMAYPVEHDAVVGYWRAHQSVAEIAAWQGAAESTVYGRITRGVKRVCYRLGYVERRHLDNS